jgi:hypothetical protein
MRLLKRLAQGELSLSRLDDFSDWVFTPFLTKKMGEYATKLLAVSALEVGMAVNILLFIALHACILRHLIKPELVDAQDPHIIRESFIGDSSYHHTMN